MEEALEAFDALVRAGKVRALGASNFTAERLAEALAVSARLGLARYQVLQNEYHLLARDGFEGELEAVPAEGIGALPYYASAWAI